MQWTEVFMIVLENDPSPLKNLKQNTKKKYEMSPEKTVGGRRGTTEGFFSRSAFYEWQKHRPRVGTSSGWRRTQRVPPWTGARGGRSRPSGAGAGAVTDTHPIEPADTKKMQDDIAHQKTIICAMKLTLKHNTYIIQYTSNMYCLCTMHKIHGVAEKKTLR